VKGATLQLTDCTITKQGVVVSVYMPDSITANFEQKILAISDIHKDSIYCDEKMLKRDLDRAAEIGAWVFCNGDWFDGQQGRKDPRGRREELKPIFATKSNYSDLIVEESYEFLKPYRSILLCVARGNHEYSYLRHNDTDLIARLLGALNSGQDHKVQEGGYGGWLRFMYHHSKTTPRGRITYKYNHGGGGNAPVTRGMIQTNRQAAATTDADITHNGHNHQEYITNIPKESINNKGQLEIRNQIYIRTPGYKSVFQKDQEGSSWEYQMGSPTPLGGVWVTLGSTDGKPAITEVSKTF
jgi:predicted phosphodiesterase